VLRRWRLLPALCYRRNHTKLETLRWRDRTALHSENRTITKVAISEPKLGSSARQAGLLDRHLDVAPTAMSSVGEFQA